MKSRTVSDTGFVCWKLCRCTQVKSEPLTVGQDGATQQLKCLNLPQVIRKSILSILFPLAPPTAKPTCVRLKCVPVGNQIR